MGPPGVTSSRFEEGNNLHDVALPSSNFILHSRRESEQAVEAVDIRSVSIYFGKSLYAAIK